MATPLRPQDIGPIAAARIPDFVIEAVNELLVKHSASPTITLLLHEVTDAAMARAPIDVTRDQLFDEHWLDFEPIYRDAGWRVTFDKPAYNETYESRFVFRRVS